MGPCLRPGVDVARTAECRRPAAGDRGTGAQSFRLHHIARCRNRAELGARANTRRQPALGPHRFRRRSKRAADPRPRRRGGHRNKSSAHVRRPGGVVQSPGGSAGPRGRSRPVVDPACRPGHPHLDGKPGCPPGGHAEHGRRTLSRKRGRPLGGRGTGARGSSGRRQRLPGPRRQVGVVHAQLPEQSPDVRRSRRPCCRCGERTTLRSHLWQILATPSSPMRVPSSGVRPTATWRGYAETSII
jgi:hypothetical protein